MIIAHPLRVIACLIWALGALALSRKVEIKDMGDIGDIIFIYLMTLVVTAAGLTLVFTEM